MKHANKPKTIKFWLMRVEQLIAVHSTPPRTRGKYKGHGSTDSCAWVAALARELAVEIRRCNRGIGYDENLALASKVGYVLAAWYALCHRAKSFDPNRPLRLRRRALVHCNRYRQLLTDRMSDDALMTSVWSAQIFNLPYGRGAIGGSFI